jgi:hypothetical protein
MREWMVEPGRRIIIKTPTVSRKHGSDPARSPTRTITATHNGMVDDRDQILAAGYRAGRVECYAAPAMKAVTM